MGAKFDRLIISLLKMAGRPSELHAVCTHEVEEKENVAAVRVGE